MQKGGGVGGEAGGGGGGGMGIDVHMVEGDWGRRGRGRRGQRSVAGNMTCWRGGGGGRGQRSVAGNMVCWQDTPLLPACQIFVNRPPITPHALGLCHTLYAVVTAYGLRRNYDVNRMCEALCALITA